MHDWRSTDFGRRPRNLVRLTTLCENSSLYNVKASLVVICRLPPLFLTTTSHRDTIFLPWCCPSDVGTHVEFCDALNHMIFSLLADILGGDFKGGEGVN